MGKPSEHMTNLNKDGVVESFSSCISYTPAQGQTFLKLFLSLINFSGADYKVIQYLV